MAVKDEALRVLAEDRDVNRAIGAAGARLLIDLVDTYRLRIYTHCNAGALACVEWGTALGVVHSLSTLDRLGSVYVGETRPLLQGSRLTAWELSRAGIDVTVIADNMAASRLRRGDVSAIFVGADRIAANGDTANKIGTYPLALAARAHGVPFYVAAPRSTFDLTIATGEGIPIEERRGAGGAFVEGEDRRHR